MRDKTYPPKKKKKKKKIIEHRTKLHVDEVTVLEIWWAWSTSLLPLLSGQLK